MWDLFICLYRYLVKSFILGFPLQTNLHWVRIYFATPTFDLITKDEKANFETKLSAIGGTMGLLTGFSIISGVEIVFFAVKITVNLVKDKFKKKEKVISNVK